jgi:hypothetical protein
MKAPTIHNHLAQVLVLTTLALAVLPARAQLPEPHAKTPTLHGGTPLQGSAVGGQIGYAALRADFFHGAGSWDLNLSAGLTFGDRWLHGYNQSLGLDLRVPFRIRLVEWRRGTGSFKVGPLFHVGRGCARRYYACRGPGCNSPRCPGPGCDAPRCPGPDCDRAECDTRAIGTGVTLGFVADVALPKLFKLIIGVEQQLGVLNLDHHPTGIDHTYFAGATWLDLGLEAFWRDAIFFTLIMNVGAQYGSDSLHYARHALFRHLIGAGYKFR